VHSMPPQHLVLDGYSQSVPAQHLFPCALQLHQELCLRSRVHWTERDGVRSMRPWNVQSEWDNGRVLAVSCEELLPCGLQSAHSVSGRLRDRCVQCHGCVTVRLQSRVLWCWMPPLPQVSVLFGGQQRSRLLPEWRVLGRARFQLCGSVRVSRRCLSGIGGVHMQSRLSTGERWAPLGMHPMQRRCLLQPGCELQLPCDVHVARGIQQLQRVLLQHPHGVQRL
jgi:hypothetical protein